MYLQGKFNCDLLTSKQRYPCQCRHSIQLIKPSCRWASSVCPTLWLSLVVSHFPGGPLIRWAIGVFFFLVHLQRKPHYPITFIVRICFAVYHDANLGHRNWYPRLLNRPRPSTSYILIPSPRSFRTSLSSGVMGYNSFVLLVQLHCSCRNNKIFPRRYLSQLIRKSDSCASVSILRPLDCLHRHLAVQTMGRRKVRSRLTGTGLVCCREDTFMATTSRDDGLRVSYVRDHFHRRGGISKRHASS